MRKSFAKKICIVAVGVSLVAGLAGCGKNKEDSTDKLRDEVVEFVNEDLASISSERDDAVAIYNSYFTSDNKEPQAFLDTLNNEAIPKMENFVEELTAIETESDEVANLKDLYLQGSQKQLDAMNKVAQAITEENTDYLTDADTDISDSKSYFTQYESALELLAIDCNITINGSFAEETDTESAGDTVEETTASEDTSADTSAESSGSIQEVTE